jgi:hypothetical protein
MSFINFFTNRFVISVESTYRMDKNNIDVNLASKK